MSLVRIPYRIGPIVRPNFFYGASSGSAEIIDQTTYDDVLKVMQGIPGPPSSGSQEYQQASASDTWTIAHNLGRKPLVDIFSVGGLGIIASVIHLSNNVVQVLFDAPTAGYAVII